MLLLEQPQDAAHSLPEALSGLAAGVLVTDTALPAPLQLTSHARTCTEEGCVSRTGASWHDRGVA